MRERDIEKYLVEQVKAIGGEVRKVKWIGRNGAPDRVVFLPHRFARAGTVLRSVGSETIWVELKAPGKKPEPHQLREHIRMRKMGAVVLVIDSLEQVDELCS